MQVVHTKIAEVKLANSIRYRGERGFFSEVFKEFDLRRHGTDINFVLDVHFLNSLLESVELVRAIETRQGLKVSRIEEVAYYTDYIDRERRLRLAWHLGKGEYGRCFDTLLDHDI